MLKLLNISLLAVFLCFSTNLSATLHEEAGETYPQRNTRGIQFYGDALAEIAPDMDYAFTTLTTLLALKNLKPLTLEEAKLFSKFSLMALKSVKAGMWGTKFIIDSLLLFSNNPSLNRVNYCDNFSKNLILEGILALNSLTFQSYEIEMGIHAYQLYSIVSHLYKKLNELENSRNPHEE